MEAMEEMKSLREKLPSGSALKALQSYDLIGDEIGNFYAHIIIIGASSIVNKGACLIKSSELSQGFFSSIF